MPANESSLSKQFFCFQRGLKMFNFDEMDIFRTISAIIFLNMIKFEDNGPNSGCTITDPSMSAVEALADLFASSTIQIKQALTGRVMRVQNQEIQ